MRKGHNNLTTTINTKVLEDGWIFVTILGKNYRTDLHKMIKIVA